MHSSLTGKYILEGKWDEAVLTHPLIWSSPLTKETFMAANGRTSEDSHGQLEASTEVKESGNLPEVAFIARIPQVEATRTQCSAIQPGEAPEVAGRGLDGLEVLTASRSQGSQGSQGTSRSGLLRHWTTPLPHPLRGL